MKLALSVLRLGGVVAAPTETLYGLLVDATNPRAIGALLAVKPRGHDKGIPLILPEPEAWRGLVTEVPPVAERLAQEFWPGPLTIALAAAPGVDPRLILNGTVAVRWPSDSPALSLARSLRRPLTATSANEPGKPPGRTGGEVRAMLRTPVGMRLRVVEGTAAGGVPSTVVAIEHGKCRIIRLGAIGEAALLRVLSPYCGIDPQTTRG
ncbi:MAG: threonylcarbamoyl-AMP synthase [Polyangiaceae bacterium]|nr:threonylcarbamoyl-AMP synthase [Polyangiaceae bacterium]